MKKENAVCKHCANGSKVPTTNDILCRYRGIMPLSASCKKFVFNPFTMQEKRMRNLDTSRFSPEDFDIN